MNIAYYFRTRKTSKSKGHSGKSGVIGSRHFKHRRKKDSKSKLQAGQKQNSLPENFKNAEDGILGAQARANYSRTKVCLDDFTLVETVGKGSFGRVIQVSKKDTGKIYAMKVLKKEQVIKRKQYEHTMAERRILEDIDHPFIVSLRFAFQTTQKLFMIFDFFNGGELFHYLSKYGRFGEVRAKLYSAEILLGIEHVHSLNIIYRDLKPENILLDSDGHIRITDFGLSKENVTDDTVKSFCGTPEYLAPEVLKRHKYGKAVDWWSLGTLLFEMIAGLPPFYDENRDKMYNKVLNAELRFPSYMSGAARSACRGMLQRDPLQRLGYNGAQEIKSHPFYSDLVWDDVMKKKYIPDYVPQTSGESDTRNIDKAFTQIPAIVTPTPANSKLIDKEFTDFTFTASDAPLGGGGTTSNSDPFSYNPTQFATRMTQENSLEKQVTMVTNKLNAVDLNQTAKPDLTSDQTNKTIPINTVEHVQISK